MRATRGIWIPIEIWELKELTVTEKVLLVEIDSLDNDQGCYASNAYFSEFLGIGEVQVSRLISRLKDFGYIDLLSYNGRTRYLKSRLSLEAKSALTSLIGLAHTPGIVSPNIDAKSYNNKNKINDKKYEFAFQIPLGWPEHEFLSEWEAFEKVRKAKRRPTTPEALNMLVADLLKFSGHEWKKAKEIIQRSIKRGYPEFYPLDDKQTINQDNDRYDPNNY